MTDARYPECWLNDRRIVRLSDAAHRLFVIANAWSASNRTDGVLDSADLALIHGVDASKAAELAAASLWEQSQDGWSIVDFHKTQTTRSQLEGLDHKRHQDRERKARQRDRDKRGDPEPTEALSRVTSPVTSDVTQRQGKDRTGKDRQGATTGTQPTEAWVVPEPGSGCCVEVVAGGSVCGLPVPEVGDRYCRSHDRDRASR